MTAYYNEFDPNAAAWLRELVNRGLIAPGDVDDRSILDVRLDDLKGYTQCHFFAGIGVWSHALRQAGWPDDRPVWTGSCPCQPFSAAGKGAGFADERHLWPAFHWLIEQRRPAVVFGEQVASKDGLAWLDLVQADLEGTGYASRAVDLCAAGVGAPHIRQRLWWVGKRLADASVDRRVEGRAVGAGHSERTGAEGPSGRTPECCRDGRLADTASGGRQPRKGDSGLCGQDVGARTASIKRGSLRPSGGLADADHRSEHALLRREQDNPAEDFRGCEINGLDGRLAGGNEGELSWMADTDDAGLEGRREPECRRAAERLVGADGVAGGLADAKGTGRREQRPYTERSRERSAAEDLEQRSGGGGVFATHGRAGAGDRGAHRIANLPGPGPVNGLWRDADWLFCRDGRWRPVEPGTFPLAHGSPARVGRLRGYGNAIVAPAAQVFIEAYLETEAGRHLQLTPETDIFS